MARLSDVRAYRWFSVKSPSRREQTVERLERGGVRGFPSGFRWTLTIGKARLFSVESCFDLSPTRTRRGDEKNNKPPLTYINILSFERNVRALRGFSQGAICLVSRKADGVFRETMFRLVRRPNIFNSSESPVLTRDSRNNVARRCCEPETGRYRNHGHRRVHTSPSYSYLCTVDENAAETIIAPSAGKPKNPKTIVKTRRGRSHLPTDDGVFLRIHVRNVIYYRDPAQKRRN